MGMTIDKTIEFFNGLECHTPQAKDARDTAIDTMRKYQMFQAKYAERLRADMVAMLAELKLEIEESENCGKAFHLGLQMASNIIQQKINALKGGIK